MKGICFIEPLFDQVVRGTKVQTRRIIDKEDFLHGKNVTVETTHDYRNAGQVSVCAHFTHISKGESFAGRPSKYKIGEILYLKEPFQLVKDDKTGETKPIYKYGPRGEANEQWKNKLSMPERYARYFIKITNIRADRLQNISDEDCIKEGIYKLSFGWAYSYYEKYNDYIYMKDSPREAFMSLFAKINGAHTWFQNPFVWIYDFELVSK